MRILLGIFFGLTLLVSVNVSASNPDYGNTRYWFGEWQGHELSVAVINRDQKTESSAELSEDGPWWRLGNAKTDAYLLSWSEDQLIDLVLDFSMENGKPVARLYVPKTMDMRESIIIESGRYTMSPDLGPDLIIRSNREDWVEDGKPVFDLEGYEANPTTGELEWEIRIGEEEPGVPGWFIRESLLEDGGVASPLFGVTQRVDESVPFEMAEPLMPTWPYLSAVDQEGHWGLIQPVFFSHETRVLEQNWSGFHIGGMYQINSISLPPATDFESPFAFYRFDEDAGRYANLVVRSDIWPEGHRHGPLPYYAQRTAVRMSWTTDRPDRWRYSLSVNGPHKHDQTVTVGDTEVVAIEYDEYPEWILSREWPGVTFVEATEGETGSEGIYDFSVEDNYPVTEWLSGIRLASPTEPQEVPEEIDELTLETLEHEPLANLHAPYLDFPQIHPLRLREGFRGEFSLEYPGQPELYVSPFDNRIHLKHAAEGIWNLGDGAVLRWKNRDGGEFIDSWWIEKVPERTSTLIDRVSIASPGRVSRSLDHLDNYLIYMDSGTIEILDLDEPPEYDAVPIPEGVESWEDFVGIDRQIEQRTRDPLRLRQWLQAQPGESQVIDKARAHGLRKTDDGFRFVLEIRTRSRSTGNEFLDIGELAPGSYLVNYDGEFSIVELTPAELSASLTDSPRQALDPGTIALTLRNRGLQDLEDASLSLLVTNSDGYEQEIGPFSIDVQGTGVRTIPVDWTAPYGATWTVTPLLENSDGEEFALASSVIQVEPAPEATRSQMLLLGTSGTLLLVGTLALLAFSGMAGISWWLLWSLRGKDEHGARSE